MLRSSSSVVACAVAHRPRPCGSISLLSLASIASLVLLVAACGPPKPAPTAPSATPTVRDAPAGDAEAICAQAPVSAETSTFFRSATIEDSNSIDLPSNGDLWPSCSSGDTLYAAWGDGFGFEIRHAGRRPDIGVARLMGQPSDAAAMHGENLVTDEASAQSLFRIWTAGSYYQKPTGMLCRGGKIFLAVQDLNFETYDNAPAATIAISADRGKTWTEPSSPMFAGGVFTTIMFVDFGPDGENAIDTYVYAYGLDHNWRASNHVLDPQGLYLARIARDGDLQSRGSWEFYAGPDGAGHPTWSRRIGDKKAALIDCTRRHVAPGSKGYSVISQGGVVYDAPLRRFIYASWTEYTFEFYEAPAPWGPWRRFLSKDFGLPPWTAQKHGGYGTTIPSRYISEDGRTMWVQSNTWSSGVDHNNVALRKLVVAP
jgi:hypothetical protein